ncbi:uncharacterized protein PRCAT00005991001 [Priceomyces carsonii]|uniref:uncharacterized protein n=1 Tax=Priceomyces carsonii TaxID=28549 RepID=UPI002EDB491D|nr:unnamed protein product [Priceomyces carsonii]
MSISTNYNAPDLQSALIAQDILSWSGSQPIYLSQIEVDGGDKFSKDFFGKLFYPLLQTQDYTLSQLMNQVFASYQRLVKTDVFKQVDISLNSDFKATVPNELSQYNKDKPIPAKVLVKLAPIDLNSGEGFLNFNSQDNLNLKLDYLNNNFNGNAELVNFGVSYNPYKPNEHLIANAKFLGSLTNPSFKFIIDLLNSYQNNHSWQHSSTKSTVGSIGLLYSYESLNLFTGISLAKRGIHDIDRTAPDEIKFFSGDNMKSSIVNQLRYSNLSYLNIFTRNFPINGFTLAVSNEVSSNQEQENLNNKNMFVKSSISLNTFKSFFNNKATAKLDTEIGGIYNPASNSPVHISDRFYLGGSESFKGFAKNAINVNGGSQYYKVGLTIYSKLPTFIYAPKGVTAANLPLEDKRVYEANPLRLYGTGLLGNVCNDLLQDRSAALTVGYGLRYFNNWANFDIGYYVSKRLGDESSFGLKDGLQFAVSIGGSNKSL